MGKKGMEGTPLPGTWDFSMMTSAKESKAYQNSAGRNDF